MDDQKPRAAGAVLLGIFAALFCLYVAGYFTLGELVVSRRHGWTTRFYEHQWLADAYWPLAKVESAVTGRQVGTGWHD